MCVEHHVVSEVEKDVLPVWLVAGNSCPLCCQAVTTHTIVYIHSKSECGGGMGEGAAKTWQVQ